MLACLIVSWGKLSPVSLDMFTNTCHCILWSFGASVYGFYISTFIILTSLCHPVCMAFMDIKYFLAPGVVCGCLVSVHYSNLVHPYIMCLSHLWSLLMWLKPLWVSSTTEQRQKVVDVILCAIHYYILSNNILRLGSIPTTHYACKKYPLSYRLLLHAQTCLLHSIKRPHSTRHTTTQGFYRFYRLL